MSPHHNPSWQHSEDGLTLRLDRRVDRVPSPLDDWLIGPEGIGTTADPASDLVRLEGHIRGIGAELLSKVGTAESTISRSRKDLDNAAGPWWSLKARDQRKETSANLLDAIEEHTTTVAELDHIREVQNLVRQFVIGADAPEGLLAESAAGWQRSPDLPTSVITFDDEDAFLTADSRRTSNSQWGYPILGGDVFGHQWRRDGDDDEPDSRPLDRSGPWMLGYLERTGEIYATRRGSYLLPQVWLLGAPFSTARAHEILAGIQPRMREPNSIILAAATVAEALLHEHGDNTGSAA
ncbi:hypothetical protein [Amycolatopsis sp. RTGN1]|uniref:hypothetical protein n=1 Tax=Amycolatopsis ponsaeliensis TaxID=2992142 RepID=UPI00254A1466|nr:hypothetical protein [Amycolatopsis sp. RTGN1]